MNFTSILFIPAFHAHTFLARCQELSQLYCLWIFADIQQLVHSGGMHIVTEISPACQSKQITCVTVGISNNRNLKAERNSRIYFSLKIQGRSSCFLRSCNCLKPVYKLFLHIFESFLDIWGVGKVAEAREETHGTANTHRVMWNCLYCLNVVFLKVTRISE